MTIKDLDKATSIAYGKTQTEMGKLDYQEVELLRKHKITSSTSIWSMLIKGILLELLKELLSIALKRAKLIIDQRDDR